MLEGKASATAFRSWFDRGAGDWGGVGVAAPEAPRAVRVPVPHFQVEQVLLREQEAEVHQACARVLHWGVQHKPV